MDGINRHLSEISLNPALMLPFEFQHLGLTVPEPWSVRDAVRFFAFVARLFGDAGGGERANQTLFNNLLTIAVSNGYADPNAAAVGMFDDLRWFDDTPKHQRRSPAKAPSANGRRRHSRNPHSSRARRSKQPSGQTKTPKLSGTRWGFRPESAATDDRRAPPDRRPGLLFSSAHQALASMHRKCCTKCN